MYLIVNGRRRLGSHGRIARKADDTRSKARTTSIDDSDSPAGIFLVFLFPVEVGRLAGSRASTDLGNRNPVRFSPRDTTAENSTFERSSFQRCA